MPTSRVCLLLAALLLAGCGGSQAPTPTPQPPPVAAATATPSAVAPTRPLPTSTPSPTFTPQPSPTPTPSPPGEAVTFTTEDGIEIAATLFGEGDFGVLLLHMGLGRATQASWQPFAQLVAEHGLAALTVDFRGCGASGGQLFQDHLIRDARAAAAFLRDRGVERLACVGASMGGTTCLRLALDQNLEGVAVLSSIMSAGPSNQVTDQELSRLRMPKLFAYGNWDLPQVTMEMARMHRAAGLPKELVVLNGSAHGTDLLDIPQGGELQQRLLDLLAGIAASPRAVDPRPPPALGGSAAGSAIAFVSNHRLHLMSVDEALRGAGEPWRVPGVRIDGGGPAWSPDGRRIAFTTLLGGNHDLFVVEVPELSADEDATPQRLTETPANEANPAWSPDGTQIAFQSDRDGDDEIYLLDVAAALQGAGDAALRQLTDNQANDANPDWSPDGTQIAFESIRDGDWELYLMDVQAALEGAGEGAIRRLTDNDVGDQGAAWSPDGSQIAFYSTRNGYHNLYVLRVAEALLGTDGSGERRLTDSPTDDWWPTWSPDGTQIAFASLDHNEWRMLHEIYIVGADGQGRTRLTRSLADNWFPAWQPSPAVTAAGGPALGDTWIRPADGMVMVYVPGGTFPMGGREDDPEAVPDELPQHLVTLDGFWIDQTEVTNGQFVQFLNEHGNSGERGARMITLDRGYTRISQEGDRFVAPEVTLDRPVLMVTWYGASEYCQWAGGRLPTEAEWEYAARGPAGNLYPWGNDPPTCELANYGDCTRAPVQVGSRPAGASWCGALDLAGNVWEWVTDWFGPYSSLPQENPTGPASGEVPVLRGGGWHSPRWELRAAYRQHEVPTTGFNG